MAKKKHKKKSGGTRRRRHRMGAIGKDSPAMKLVAIAGVAFLDNLVKKNKPTMSVKTLGTIEAVAGFFGPGLAKRFLPASMAPYVDIAADGLLAVGTINLMRGFQVISGVGAMPMPARVALQRNAISPNQLAIGAAGRPYLNQNVGEMPYEEQQMMMGALMYED